MGAKHPTDQFSRHKSSTPINLTQIASMRLIVCKMFYVHRGQELRCLDHYVRTDLKSKRVIWL